MGRSKTVAALFAAAARTDRRVSVWMRRHHADLVVEFGTGRVAWRRVLPILAELGLTDEVGQPLTRDTTARTWKRVCRERAAQQCAAVQPTTMPPLAPGELAPGVRSLATTPMPQAPASARPVALRDAPRVAPADLAPTPARPGTATLATPEGVPEVMEATEQIRRVLDEMGAMRVPLPTRTR